MFYEQGASEVVNSPIFYVEVFRLIKKSTFAVNNNNEIKVFIQKKQ